MTNVTGLFDRCKHVDIDESMVRAIAMQLRFLQTLSSIATDKSNTIVFPVPVDMIGPIVESIGRLSRGR